jgi:hypothetical protein
MIEGAGHGKDTMATPTLLLLMLALDNPKITAALAEGPGPKIVCEGTADVPDGIILNVELYIKGEPEKLFHALARVKDGAFGTAFEPFKGRERNLPGEYRVKVHYHGAFQPKPLENVDPFFIEAAATFGSPAEIQAAHKAVRERLIADLQGFKVVAEDVQAAFDAAKGKPEPADWRKKVPAWQKGCADIESRVAGDPDYRVLGFNRITQTSTEYLREKVRGLVEYGGNGRAPEFQLSREQFDGMLRSILIELAPAGSSTADRRQLVSQARGALIAALEAEGPAFAGTRRQFTEAVFRLSMRATGLALEILRQVNEDGAAYFEQADASRDAARKLFPPLDRKLEDALKELTKPE